MTSKGNLFGFDRAFLWRVGSNGIASGQLDPVTPGSAPLTSHAYEATGVMASEIPGANFGTHEFRGGGAYEGKADSGLENLTDGTLQLSQADIALAVMLAGGLQDVTTIAGGPIIWGTNDLNPSPRQVGLMLIRGVQSRVTATAGVNYYDTVIYPLVQMRMIYSNFSQDAGVNTGAITCSIKPQVASRFPWGVAFGSNQDWYNNTSIWAGIRSVYPWAMTSFLQDGVETDTVLAYEPIYDTVTNGNTNSVHSVNGTVTAPSSITIATATVVMGAAGTANQFRTHFYQSLYVAP
jgi:hypothetical protein